MGKYVNPIGQGLTIGRIDEGVDFAGSGDLYAMGDGTIKSVTNSGWPGGVYITLAMDDGKNVYYAENIAPNVSVGQKVKAGQKIGYARGTYPFVEIGWSSPTPGNALASGHYSEGQATAEGKDFAALLNTFGLKIPGASGSSTMGGSAGGTPAPAGGIQTTGFDWNLSEIPGLGQLGKVITGTTGAFSSIGDMAKAIAGLASVASKFTQLIMMLFRPEFWLRVGAFLFGLLTLGAAVYFLREAM
jgi:murein DD-endopeptidase MepM/ murein hydrolase activator NlpD